MTRHVTRYGTMIYVEIRTPSGRVVCGCGRRDWDSFRQATEYCRECCALKGHEHAVEEGE